MKHFLSLAGCILLAFAPAMAQTPKVSLDEKDVSVKQFVRTLEEKTGYTFAYLDSDIDPAVLVTVSASDRPVLEVLAEVLPDMEATVKGRQIVLTRKEKAHPGGNRTAAAPRRIKGLVYDDNGDPVVGAVLIVTGTREAAVTDSEGRYSIEAAGEAVLNVSCLGYITKDVRVGAGAVQANIELPLEMLKLEDAVVVGYGTQKKVNLSGSVASISTDAFAKQPITQASTALQGMAAGVTVTTGGGAPGADGGTIRIRGIGTFGGSSAAPLVLIDGVQGDINSVEASQIDKISVLKDAASSAIYGSRAANGVILITTKRGVKGQSSLTYRNYFGYQEPTALPELVTAEEYMMLANEATVNDGGIPLYSDEYISHYRENHYLDPDNYPITNWQKRVLTGSGFTQSHNLVLTTSSEKVRMMTSFGYLDQDGIINNTGYHRYNMRNNMNVEILRNLHFRFDTSVNYGRRKQVQHQGGVFTFMNARDPLMLAQWSDGNYAAFTGGTLNILPMIEKGEGGNIRRNALNLTGAAALTWEPFKWLTLEGTVAPRFVLNGVHNFEDLVTYYSDAYGTISNSSNAEYSSLTESLTQYFYGNYQFTATAHKKLGNHDLKALVGASFEDMTETVLSGYRQEFAYPEYEVLSAGAANEYQVAKGTVSQWALQSFFGRLNYNYKERYLLEGNIRYDGSSRFAKGHRWGVFPSFSGAWRVSEEPWLQPARKVLTELKFRASYGELGNQNIGSDYYPTIQTLTISSIYAGSTLYPIVGLNNLANEDITWETSKMTDFGIDAALWNKIDITADWYYKTTDGILLQLAIPQTIGLSAPYQNAGVVRNIGWEFNIGYKDSKGDFTWSASANLSDVRNKIIDMKGTYSGSGAIRNQEGSSINSLYGLKCYGMIRTQEQADWVNMNCPQYNIISKPGDLVYEDYNKDGKIDNDDMQIIGSCIPRYTFGFTLSGGWKGLNLSAQFQGVGQADAYLSGYYTQPCVQGGTFRKEHLDRWTAATPNGRFPRMSYGNDNTLNTKTSTFWMGDASYMRLKNLQLSYTFPKALARKAGMKNLMFYLNATNLLTFTNYYQGYDPEGQYSSGDDGATSGSFASNYPLVRTYTFGMEIKF